MINLSPETEAIIKAKADLTGRTPDQVVREVLARTGDVLPWRNTSSAPKTVTREALITGMEEIASRCAARPVIDPRSIDEIIGYDDFGLPRGHDRHRYIRGRCHPDPRARTQDLLRGHR